MIDKTLYYSGKIQLPRQLFNRFKACYPSHGDFSNLLRKLLVEHLDKIQGVKNGQSNNANE